MENKTKKPAAPAEADQAAGPIKVFILDEVSAGVFSRAVPVNGNEQTFYSVSFSRSYRDSSGTRKYVKTFNPEDLPKVGTVAQQAKDYIHDLQQSELA